jgi:hypothetical protein
LAPSVQPTFVQPLQEKAKETTALAPIAKDTISTYPPSTKIITPATYHADLKGKIGTPINVIVNYFRMNVNVPNIYQYDIKYEV